MIQRQFLSVPFFLEENTEPIQQLLQTYRNVPMSLADACLVRMTELYPQAVVLTLDSDFQIYRKNRIEPIACIAPWVMPG